MSIEGAKDFGVIIVRGPEGFDYQYTEIYLSQNGDDGICLEFSDTNDGWRVFMGILHPDEADLIADALKKAAQALREDWAKNGGPTP
jgi:hypothetical protein